MDEEALKRLGCRQIDALEWLCEHDGMCVREYGNSGLKRVLESLLKRGLVSVSYSTRCMWFEITTEGKAAYEEAERGRDV